MFIPGSTKRNNGQEGRPSNALKWIAAAAMALAVVFVACRAARSAGNDAQEAAAAAVKRYAKYVSAAGRYAGKNDVSFFSSVAHYGEPREIKIGGVTALLEVPVIAADYTARMMYISPGGGAVSYPLAHDNSGRLLLAEREWNESAGTPMKLPAQYFEPLPRDYRAPDFPMVIRERYSGIYELAGMPFKKTELEGFSFVSFIDSVPDRRIARKKIRVSRDDEFSPEAEFAPVKSMSYAASYCADWWRIASADTTEIVFPAYSDAVSKKNAFGTDPRMLETLYRIRAADNPDVFGFSGYLRDPLFPAEPVHASLEAYASLLVLPEETAFADHSIPARKYSVDAAAKFNMGEEYISIFEYFDGTDETLVSALKMHGVVLAGLSFYMNGVPLRGAAKGVAVIGHGKAAGTTVFAYRDFEDEPGVVRIAPAGLFREAHCFPHEFTAKARYIVKQRKLVIETRDKKGFLTDADRIEATFPDEDREVKFLRESRGSYFHQVKKEDFKGVDRATLDANVFKKYYNCGDNGHAEVRYAIY